jgi:hypothetical protein
MHQLRFAVDDRVRVRNSIPHPAHVTGTIALVYLSALGYYDVVFDTDHSQHTVHARDIGLHPSDRTTTNGCFSKKV